MKALGMNSLRLAFTIEDYQTTKETAQAYISRYVYDRPVDFEGDYQEGISGVGLSKQYTE